MQNHSCFSSIPLILSSLTLSLIKSIRFKHMRSTFWFLSLQTCLMLQTMHSFLFTDRVVNHQSRPLYMIRQRGLEVLQEGATPLPGDMILYVKAGPDGTSLGDCPFAHYVQMVLQEKGLDYELRPCTPDKKPSWLIENYSGSMPALRHRRECYVESDVIAQYLDFFFQEPPLSLPSNKKKSMVQAKQCIDGFFPSVAKYLKQTQDDDEEERQLRVILDNLEVHLSGEQRTGPYFVDDGRAFTLLDCSLAPKLYHLIVGEEHFKQNALDLPAQYPKIQKYFEAVSQRNSFQNSLYPRETIIWGWAQARNK